MQTYIDRLSTPLALSVAAALWVVAWVVMFVSAMLIGEGSIPMVVALPINLVAFVIIGIGSIIMYFLPTIVANKRRHRNMMALFVLNIVFG